MEDALPRRVRVRHVAADNTQWRGLKRSLGLGFQDEDTKSVFLISVCYIMLMIWHLKILSRLEFDADFGGVPLFSLLIEDNLSVWTRLPRLVARAVHTKAHTIYFDMCRAWHKLTALHNVIHTAELVYCTSTMRNNTTKQFFSNYNLKLHVHSHLNNMAQSCLNMDAENCNDNDLYLGNGRMTGLKSAWIAALICCLIIAAIS